MRKTFTLLIALLALTVSTWAQTQIGPIDGLYYEVNDVTGEATLIQDPYSGSEYSSYSYSVVHDALVIPATVSDGVNNYPVKSIGNRAFMQCGDITSVMIPEGVETIGANAFDGCQMLSNVTLPSTITSLGSQAFAYIGNNAYTYRSIQTTIAIYAETPASYNFLFDQCNALALAHIYVPAASVDAYKAANGWSNHASIIEALPTVEWNQSEVTSVSVLAMSDDYLHNFQDPIKGIKVTAYSPTSSDYADFSSGNIYIHDNGIVTFAPSFGKLQRIVISCDPEGYSSKDLAHLATGTGWSWDNSALKLTWKGDATSVDLTCDGSSSGIYVGDIISVEFDYEYEEPATPTPTPTPEGPSFIWAERQVSHVDLQSLSESETKTTPVIKNIIASLKRTDAYGQCKFTDKELYINSCGKLTFKSIVGELTGITITCDPYNDVWNSDIQPSAEWTYDSEAKTFTWAGTPSEEVTISGNIDFLISSIEFFYTPAAAPRKGEQFMGDYYQIYEITGAHTAKLPAQTIDHTLNIPASVEYYGDTYYITEIGDYAFYHNEDLPNIMGGKNIAKIGAQAFDGCLRMDEANFESTVIDTIGEAAFFNCKLMFSFMCETEFPPVLGSSVFYNDNYLNHIRVFTPSDYQTADGWNWYADKIGGMYPTPAIGEQFFWHNQMTSNLYEVSSTEPREAKVLPYNATVNAIYPITRTGTLVIPEMADYMNFSYNITGIGANAYKNETDIDLVVMPLAMKSIESGAFLGCTGVEKVYFLWDDPTTVTWADANVGDEFKTATGGTKIFVPKGKLEVYQTWAPAWRDCMIEGDVVDAVATEDPDNHARYFRTFYDSSSDYMMPAGVWAHAGYVSDNTFILRPVAFDGQILPRGTAVVLESDTREYRLIPMGNDAPLYDGRNELVGTDENLEVSTLGTNSDKVYVLNTQATIGGDLHVGMGMYKYTGSTLGAHKAYLIYDAPAGPNTAPARFVFKHENQATGVENVQSDKVQCTKVIRDGQLIIIKDGKEYNAQGLIIK